MPSSIPFDHPSMVLGNVIEPGLLGDLKKISALQSGTDSAQEKMNSQIALKRSLAMTINELAGMSVDVSSLVTKMKEIDASIVQAADGYVNARLTNETAIQQLREKITSADAFDNSESPVDFDLTQIKGFPLASDSLKLDAQYFSYDENNEDNPLDTVSSIENYIRESSGNLGTKASTALASTSASQIKLQRKNHKLSGTLLITANCTHKCATLLSPCVIDIDKAIPVWNTLYTSDKINSEDYDSMVALSKTESGKEENSIPLISGATYGSSFVGMVHILRQEYTGNNASMIDLAGQLQERLTIGSWLEASGGGLGIDRGFADDVRNLLSTQRISSHITVVVMGLIPSIKSNQMQLAVKSFAEVKPEKLLSGVSAISNATASDLTTVEEMAGKAQTGAKVLALQGATIHSILTSLASIDSGANKTMDTNSMMTAFEDFLQEVKNGKSGIPVNVYLKTLTKKQLASLWLKKYHPEKSQS